MQNLQWLQAFNFFKTFFNTQYVTNNNLQIIWCGGEACNQKSLASLSQTSYTCE